MGNARRKRKDGLVTSHEVREVLELDILLGRLRPRERLVEDELMDRFVAKRHVIRSALMDLERLGIVVRPPNRGAMVRDYSADEVEEIYAFRGELHRIAVNRMELPLEPDIVETLSDLADRHERAIKDGDLAAVIKCNNEFHDTLFDQCRNRFLAESIRQLGWTSHAIRSYRVGDPVLLKQAAEEHRQIIAAAAKGDRTELVLLCEKHIEPSKRLYLQDQL